ncbi:hypothetical protein AGMMS49940_15310 [Spirochaetia bacterium]|nr:hypothetical protein AGMMS49940_15310 [Spirochaetia bacterium]
MAKWIKHGDRANGEKTRMYVIWNLMRQRCLNQKSTFYHRYGGRGITICKDWLDDYQNFKYWALKNGYADNLTLDRIDNDQGYSPDNCRWATAKEQADNRITNHKVTYRGKTQDVTQWAEELGMSAGVIFMRLFRGWSVERTFEQPVRKVRKAVA